MWMEVHPLVYFRGPAIFIMRVACFNCVLLIPLINCGAFVAFHSPLDGGAVNQQEFQWPREKRRGVLRTLIEVDSGDYEV